MVKDKAVEKVQSNSIEIAYQDYGSKDDPAVILIMGLGGQLVHWPDSLVSGLVERGLRVIRLDNRDAGESAQVPRRGIPWPMLMRMALARFGLHLKASYSLDDMAADTVGLMDALGIHKAHIVGLSMGGMIAQSIVINYPHRVSSLTSIMSHTGNTKLPPPDQQLVQALVSPVPDDRQAAIDGAVELWKLLGGDHFPIDEKETRMISELAFDRAANPPNPSGIQRQLEAILSAKSRSAALGAVFVPSLVIHGKADRLVPPEGGEDTAHSIPGAKLEMIEGMGHALQPGVVEKILPLIADHITAAN